ncbi:hypothetical protein GWK08_00130 [Leptobacterium flavescens]|uniref:DUF2946 domain-containing protein n=1 Tax=Leptobacterium flavescens TaxID=472055 RepID=A0A6P0UNE8_9FLAO|nr:DUF6660 family protein [Leptobacterium flavescens]NER11836.1 hypothetical protein [Leptobacterium flavescens]
MKILAVILSFYFLGLNFMPCSDALENEKDATEFVSQTDADHDHDHDGDSEELCSPFCQCHCCHAHVTSDLKTYDIFNPLIPNVIISKFDNGGKEFLPSFFQPPRL